jgi:alkanesulfonate monooxygenase SsuD/methylene tetrahydromethanopterin reductase-like flavin-dependent oxidoreductase (luciferase family)
VRVSLFYQIQVPKPWTASSESERIHEALEQIPFAEEQGFSSVWFSEHHFRPVWSHNSAPDLISQRSVSAPAVSAWALVWSSLPFTTRCTWRHAWRRSIS